MGTDIADLQGHSRPQFLLDVEAVALNVGRTQIRVHSEERDIRCWQRGSGATKDRNARTVGNHLLRAERNIEDSQAGQRIGRRTSRSPTLKALQQEEILGGSVVIETV